MRKSLGSGRSDFARQLRQESKTWVQIAVELRSQWPGLTPRAALRVAHSWTQDQAADEWNHRWAPPHKAGKDFSLWETWPNGGRRPSFDTFDKLAQLYECSISDLLTDVGDYRDADDANKPPVPSEASLAPRTKPSARSVEDGVLSEMWHTNSGAEDLAKVIDRIETVAMNASGPHRAETVRLAACAHLVLGESAFDQLHFVSAIGHFQQAHELGTELDDPDLVTLALVQQADVARRRRRYDSATRLFRASEQPARSSVGGVQARRWQFLARAYAERGDATRFFQAIDQAQECAHDPGDTGDLPTVDPLTVQHEQAHGLTLLGRPNEALDIYVDEPNFSVGRDRTNFRLIKAQALAHAGELEAGIDMALPALAEARSFGSSRFVSRVQRFYDRLVTTHSSTEPHVARLHDALTAP